jgi:hypothetical protein
MKASHGDAARTVERSPMSMRVACLGLCVCSMLIVSGCQPRAVSDLLAQAPESAEAAAFADVPDELLAQCRDDNGKLAEPGAVWLAGNFIWNAALPRHRLIWAVKAGRYHVVHFERGGFAHTYRVLVAQRGDDGAMQVRLRADSGRFEHYAHFVQALRTHRFEHVEEEISPFDPRQPSSDRAWLRR